MNSDLRGILRGACIVCQCTGYNGGSEKKKCVYCSHPPGKHQNMSTPGSIGSSLSSHGSSTSFFSPSSLTTAGRASPGADCTDLTISPVYQCAYPGCVEETPFDPYTGDQQRPYCDQHFIEAAQSYAQLQQSLAANSAPTQSSNQQFQPRFQQRDDSGLSCPPCQKYGVSLSGNDEYGDDFEIIDADSVSTSRPMRSLGPIQSDSGAALNTSRIPCATSAPGMVQRMDGKVSPEKRSRFKLKKSCLNAPVRAPAQAQAWLPTTTDVTTPNLTAPSSMPLPVQQCKLPGCGLPVYVDQQTGRAHDFCAKRHAIQYQQQHAAAANPLGTTVTIASTPDLQNPSGYGTCSLPGCTRPKYSDPANGRVHDFCGRRHATQARAQGISQVTIRLASRQEFTKVSRQFRVAWTKGTCPKVDVVVVISNCTLVSRWRTYMQQLRDQTVEEHYHGTKLTCDLSKVPCNDEECGICGISSSGLDRRCIQKNINFQRFGHGFYLAPNSSKCHDYTQGCHGYRAMLLCHVSPGVKYPLKTDKEKLAGPPPGFDSIDGQVGRSLNYAEIVVYNPDAVVPRYIIVYQKDGVNKIAQ